MFITIINDCRDENARNRQATRASALFGVGATVVGVSTDLEAAGNLVDAIDAADGQDGVILVNVAPRNGKAKRWPNGTPFGSFRHGNTLVVSSIDGATLSLVRKLGIADTVAVHDIPAVMAWATGEDLLTERTGERIVRTQFRSYEFVPRCAKWLHEGRAVPSEPYAMNEVQEAPTAVWWVDNFGNCKTTILAEEFEGEALRIGDTDIRRHARLKDVPDGELALIEGSSGIDERRFLEIVRQGGSAATELGILPGEVLTPRVPQAA